jgi:chorismate mutase
MEVYLDIEPLSSWGLKNTDRPMVMAGPCSAETEEQTIETAKAIAAKGVEIYRAGIWKPRTRPNSFEGVGTIGLQWLRKVKEETGMLTATEVANVKHVFEALKYGVDILWIGARTTANPFAVQEIADALNGVDIPVLVKNPVNPDVELWIGALERLNHAGIKKLGAIHRGFSSYEKSVFRNVPQWQIPIEIRRRMRNLPMICDPSHITGNSDMIYDISQKAMDLSHDGLIIETHLNPKKALSDAKQQVTPDELEDILKRLVLREAKTEKKEAQEKLMDLRQQIDMIDDELLNVLERRMQVSDKLGHVKKEHNIRILQTNRWDEILKNMYDKGLKKGLSEEFIERLFRAIHQESINLQTKIMNEE